jgi:diadenosine tetraphosphate (Ap4A) HIT family hydrolase
LRAAVRWLGGNNRITIETLIFPIGFLFLRPVQFPDTRSDDLPSKPNWVASARRRDNPNFALFSIITFPTVPYILPRCLHRGFRTNSPLIRRINDLRCKLVTACISSSKTLRSFFNTPEFILKNMIVVSQKLVIRYKNLIGSTGLNLFHASGVSAQQSVLHFHIHLIPRFANDGLNAWPKFPPASFDKDKIWNKLKL